MPLRTTRSSGTWPGTGSSRLWHVVEQLTGLPEEPIRAFFAQGMLLNVVAAIDATSIDESWARACQEPDHELFFESPAPRNPSRLSFAADAICTPRCCPP